MTRPLNTLALLALVAAAGCGADPEEHAAGAAAAVPARTAVVRSEAVAEEFAVGGTVRGRKTAVISSRIVSSIVDVAVRPGDRVRAGAVLLRLDARQLDAVRSRADASLSATLEAKAAIDAEVESAGAALALARSDHARISGLAERKVATTAELDAVTAALRGAEARAKAAAARRAETVGSIEAARASARAASVDASYAVITAPFDGVVTEKTAEPGALAAPGAPLVTLEDVRQFRLEIGVDASQTTGLAVGAKVPVDVTGIGEVEGTIEEVAAAVDPRAHTYAVKLLLPPVPSLRSGLYGRARLRAVPQQRTVVPSAAVVQRGQLTLVFVDDKGTARLRFVHTGARAGQDVTVLSGLSAGERVVLNPPDGLADGARLTPTATVDGSAK